MTPYLYAIDLTRFFEKMGISLEDFFKVSYVVLSIPVRFSLRLKKIILFGFKSFAEKTTLEFHPGITAIVGPNGCGKSNIADAFRWVLGEQSAKLRGQKIQDVIFAGTSQNRHPLNLCEVTVTLTDIKDELPIEYDEISVSRRLHKSGESEYLLNGNEVRLKDIQTLFFDSGIGKEAFSIFEQGKIDQVIQYTPLERRSIFEEAAGIVRFLYRKKEALRKLEQTDLNLSRLEDIFKEVTQRVLILEKQAEKAQLFKEKKQSLDLLERKILATKWNSGSQRLKKLGEKEKEISQHIQTIHDKIAQLKQSSHETRVGLHDREQALKARSSEMYLKRNQRDLHLRDKTHLSKKNEDLQRQLTSQKEEINTLTEQEKKATLEDQELSKKNEEIKAILQNLKHSLEESKKEYQNKAILLEESRQHYENRQRKQLSTVQEHSEKFAKWNQFQERLSLLEERLPTLLSREKQLLIQKDETLSKQNAKADELRILSDEIDVLKSQLEVIEKSLAKLKETFSKQQSQRDSLSEKFRTIQARLKALKEIKESMEGSSKATKHLLEESRKTNSPFYKKLTPLYELIPFETESKKAFAAALRPYQHVLTVHKREDLFTVISFAKKNKLQDFALFCSENLTPHMLFEHFFNHINIIQEINEDFENHSPLWSEEGIFVDINNVLFYTPTQEGNTFLREAEIVQLEDEKKILEKEKILLDSSCNDLQQQISEMQIKKASIDKLMRTQEMKLIEVNHSLLRHQADNKRLEEEYRIAKDEVSSMQNSIQDLSEHCIQLKSEVSIIEEKLNSTQISQKEYQNLEEKALDVKKAQQHFDNLQQHLQTTVNQERQLIHALELLQVRQFERNQRLKKLQEENSATKKILESLHETNIDSGTQLEELNNQLKKLEESCSQLEENTSKSKALLQKLQEDIQIQQDLSNQAENENNKISLLISQLNNHQESLSQLYQEKYGESQITPDLLLKDINNAEREFKQIKQEIDDTHDINMLAIEECEQDKQRQCFLDSQLQDVKNSKLELLKMITDLDSQSRKLFKETFYAIKTNFQKNFTTLFQGGEADLQFVENQDILESGIEIIAKPPGKQMRAISLLSGGEKCLTAMALLFAIFEVKPSPYCILDEIDAPLDDTNVERFLTVVKQFVDRCQFIIITHNKRTMAIADRIYGVSMQEKGVSKLLRMEFENSSVALV